MLRLVLSSLVAIGGAGGLVASAAPAGATAPHSVAGTYQVFAPGLIGEFTMVLLPDGTVEGSLSTWSIDGTRVTIEAYGGPATPTVCVQHHQPPTCAVNVVSTGRKTPGGIASQQAPGLANVYVGSALLSSSPFWAVRTGKV